MTVTHKIGLLESFQCLGADCADTCCKDWSMQCNAACQSNYQANAPELMEALEETDVGLIMKKDPSSGFCMKFEDGICSIHRDYGEDFLGDACHFFPRSMRAYDDARVMSASLSCPEVVRMGVLGDAAWDWQQANEPRAPESLKDYSISELSPEQQLELITQFQDYIQQSDASSAEMMLHLCSVGQSLASQAVSMWPQAVPFYLHKMPSMLQAGEVDAMAGHKLLQALLILISAMPRPPRERMQEVLSWIVNALHVDIDPVDMTLHFKQPPEQVHEALSKVAAEHASQLEMLMKKWLLAQLSISGTPFSGFGDDIPERMRFLAMRFALTRLGLLALWQSGEANDERVVQVVQSLARALDHLADPALTRAVCNDMGWQQNTALAAMVMNYNV